MKERIAIALLFTLVVAWSVSPTGIGIEGADTVISLGTNQPTVGEVSLRVILNNGERLYQYIFTTMPDVLESYLSGVLWRISIVHGEKNQTTLLRYPDGLPVTDLPPYVNFSIQYLPILRH